MQSGVYFFTGDISTFEDCYKTLVDDKKITPDQYYNQNALVMIKDLELKLNCASLCRTPRFWHYKAFYNGSPEHLCLNQIKQISDNSNNLELILIATITTLSFLLLLTLCGICRSKDRCFNSIRGEKQPQESREVVFTDMSSMRTLNQSS